MSSLLDSFNFALDRVAPTNQRCPACGTRFRVPDGEGGEHTCPRCGHGGDDDKPAECTVCGGAIPNWLYDAGQLHDPCSCSRCDGCGENVTADPSHRCDDLAA